MFLPSTLQLCNLLRQKALYRKLDILKIIINIDKQTIRSTEYYM